MSPTSAPFPDTLVLPFTTLKKVSPGNIATQIQQGNTFSVAFDMRKAPHAPGEDGLVYLKTDPESNFQAANQVQLSNAGIAGKIEFIAVSPVKATIFGKEETITGLALSGTPNGAVFSWVTSMNVGGCTIYNR